MTRTFGSPVCLQINLAPGDLRYVVEILPHQLRALAGQVDEIQFTLDTRQSRAFRAATGDYAEKLAELRELLGRFCSQFPQAYIVEVDYDPARIAEVAASFIGGDQVPLKACDGSAFYAYLYGLQHARADLIFHTDSDMLFGGGSQSWIAEARQILEEREDVFACFPFPGPPRPDGAPPERRLTSIWNDVSFEQTCVTSDAARGAYRFNEVTTRAFMFDRRRFLSGDLRIPLARPRLRRKLRAILVNTPPFLLLEDCLTVMMHDRQLGAIGFLGTGSGMWSLHPRFRTELLYARLEELIGCVERDDIPAGQRGDFDMNFAMIDWSEVYRNGKRWRKIGNDARLAAFALADRLATARERS